MNRKTIRNAIEEKAKRRCKECTLLTKKKENRKRKTEEEQKIAAEKEAMTKLFIHH